MTDPSLYTDQELFRQIAEGDEQAFRIFFHRYQPQLLPFVRELVHAIGDPAEILQETFLKLWQYRSNLRDVESPKGYIVRIVSNEAAGFMRRHARYNQLLTKVMQRQESTPLTPEQQLALKEVAGLVAEAVDQLPPACQQVYTMSRDRELSAEEIATELGISKHTVNNQLAKALKAIRKHVQAKGVSAFLLFPVIF